MRTRQLSILIPTHNDSCLDLVRSLWQQARAERNFMFEIIVGNDGSTLPGIEREMGQIVVMPCCNIVSVSENVGRSAMRNLLARSARYDWLLFIDAHMRVCTADFIKNYLESEGDVVFGGYTLADESKELSHNLRYRYEKNAEFNRKAELRKSCPSKNFKSSNFLIRRTLFLEHPFDERFKRYGYEDVLFGKELEKAHAPICHIDNPVMFPHFENGASFLRKTEAAMQTLRMFRDELQGYSRLLDICGRLERLRLSWLPRLVFSLTKGMCLRNITGNNPSLKVFAFYKLGYYLSLREKA